MNAIQIVAIARIVERICGTAAAASYLAEAVAAFDKKTRPGQPQYDGPNGTEPGPSATSTEQGPISPRPLGARS